MKDKLELVPGIPSEDGRPRWTIRALDSPLSFEKGAFMVVRAIQLLVSRNRDVVLVGLAGPSGSGKTSFSKKLRSFMPGAVVLSMDMYNDGSKVIDGNFDDPRITDYDTLLDNLRDLRSGRATDVPIYDFKVSKRVGYRRVEVPQSRVVVLEGIYALSPRLRPLLDLRVSIAGGVHLDLLKRVLRDVSRSGMAAPDIIAQVTETVYPMYKAFIEPDLQTAHIRIQNSFNPFTGFMTPTYILKSDRKVSWDRVRWALGIQDKSKQSADKQAGDETDAEKDAIVQGRDQADDAGKDASAEETADADGKAADAERHAARDRPADLELPAAATPAKLPAVPAATLSTLPAPIAGRTPLAEGVSPSPSCDIFGEPDGDVLSPPASAKGSAADADDAAAPQAAAAAAPLALSPLGTAKVSPFLAGEAEGDASATAAAAASPIAAAQASPAELPPLPSHLPTLQPSLPAPLARLLSSASAATASPRAGTPSDARLDETCDLYLVPPHEDVESCGSWLRMRYRDGRFSLMFEEWVTDGAVIISPRVTFEVPARILGGLLALGYELGAVMRRCSAALTDGATTVKIDEVEGMPGRYVQVQGRDRARVVEVGRRLGLDGSYLPLSYIELARAKDVTDAFNSLTEDVARRFALDGRPLRRRADGRLLDDHPGAWGTPERGESGFGSPYGEDAGAHAPAGGPAPAAPSAAAVAALPPPANGSETRRQPAGERSRSSGGSASGDGAEGPSLADVATVAAAPSGAPSLASSLPTPVHGHMRKLHHHGHGHGHGHQAPRQPASGHASSGPGSPLGGPSRPRSAEGFAAPSPARQAPGAASGAVHVPASGFGRRIGSHSSLASIGSRGSRGSRSKPRGGTTTIVPGVTGPAHAMLREQQLDDYADAELGGVSGDSDVDGASSSDDEGLRGPAATGARRHPSPPALSTSAPANVLAARFGKGRRGAALHVGNGHALQVAAPQPLALTQVASGLASPSAPSPAAAARPGLLSAQLGRAGSEAPTRSPSIGSAPGSAAGSVGGLGAAFNAAAGSASTRASAGGDADADALRPQQTREVRPAPADALGAPTPQPWRDPKGPAASRASASPPLLASARPRGPSGAADEDASTALLRELASAQHALAAQLATLSADLHAAKASGPGLRETLLIGAGVLSGALLAAAFVGNRK